MALHAAVSLPREVCSSRRVKINRALLVAPLISVGPFSSRLFLVKKMALQQCKAISSSDAELFAIQFSNGKVRLGQSDPSSSLSSKPPQSLRQTFACCHLVHRSRQLLLELS